MPSLDDAVAIIQAHAAPVLFLDTCVLLDIIRAPLRNTASTVQAAQELLTGAQRVPPTIYPVISYAIPTEWSDHVAEVVADCDIAVKSVNAVSEAWGFLGESGLPILSGLALTLPDQLKSLSLALRNAAVYLDKDLEALSRAFDRVIKAELPAKKGGKGAKDAVILEQALGLTIALRHKGFTQTCIFASSNTSDFAVNNTTKLHPDLKPAFDPPTNLKYAASLTEAVNLLKGQGWVP